MIYLFPTFPMRSPDFDPQALTGYPEIFKGWMDRVEQATSIHLNSFKGAHFSGVGDETLREQYLCIAEGLAMAQWARARLAPCAKSTSYSMGIFAALVDANAISLEDALLLAKMICREAHGVSSGQSWAVGVLLNFSDSKVLALIKDYSLAVEISDVYTQDTLLICGATDQVERALIIATDLGAQATRLLPMSAPFHTTYLQKTEAPIMDFLKTVEIKSPSWPILSSLTQKWLLTKQDILAELSCNVSRPMNWMNTILTLASPDSDGMIECGSSAKLTESVKKILGQDANCTGYLDFEGLHE